MKFVSKLFLLLAPALTLAEPLIHLEDAKNPCAEYGCRYFEWKIPSLPGIRYIASGYEDGIDYAFYRVRDDGSYEVLLHVNPVIVDSDGKHWWGYPWLTTGIVVRSLAGAVHLCATFKHSIVRDGVLNVPEWQTALPVVLFEGKPGRTEQEPRECRPFTMSDLVTRAGER